MGELEIQSRRSSALFLTGYVMLVYSAHLCLTLLHSNTNEWDTMVLSWVWMSDEGALPQSDPSN